MELGIKAHKTRGCEVIKILESLGGHNILKLEGSADNYFYYITEDNFKYICSSYIGQDEIKGYEIFSLEDFLEKFPYKVGDKVNVWKYYLEGRSELEEAEITSMRWNSARCEVAYRFKDITGEIYKSDIKGKVDDDSNKQNECKQCGRVFGSVKCFDVDCPNNTPNYSEIDKQCFDEVHKRYSDITHVFLTGHGYTLPDGFHLVDENGKTIDASKIKLVKNVPSYPKTYEECCDVLNIDPIRRIEYEESWGFRSINQYDTDILAQLKHFRKLLICRDAYWKIAGKELGFGKAWEPDFSDDSPKYNIFKYENEITLSDNNWSNRILVFPTIEMRNAFHENFKELIEQCKELL